MTALDIITGALLEINAIALSEQPNSSDASFGLNKLNDILDEWSARKLYIYSENFPTYTLVPALNPHTIGPMASITQTSLTNNVATYTSVNRFSNGESVTVAGTTNGGGVFNVTGIVQSVTAGQFSLPLIHANIAPAADTGTAVEASNPTPTFATPQMGPRPQRIEQANLVLNNIFPVVDLPLTVRDSTWWMNQRVKYLQTDIPVDLYYDATYPNGSIYLWPVPNYAYQIRLKLWGVISQFPSLTYHFEMPPGYKKAIKLTLARDMVGAFQGTWTPQQESAWQRALKAILVNNNKSPRGDTGDVGMPGMQTWGDWNYYSGMPNQ